MSHREEVEGPPYPEATTRLLNQMRIIIEGIPIPALAEVIRPTMFDRLRQVEGFAEYFAEYEATVKAEAKAEVAALFKKAAAKVREAEAKAEAKAATDRARFADALADFLVQRGDKPTAHAFNTIAACRNTVTLVGWLKRAYCGETAAELFPEPQHQAG